MKLLRVENDRYVFKLVPRERELLTIVLRLYPVIPAAHPPLGKVLAPEKATQRLLDEALAEQRGQNKKLVESLLTDPKRFRNGGDFTEMILTTAEIEWVLQVLNDVHVGHWILLGSPNERPRFSPESTNARLIVIMDLACMFQTELLGAISRA